LEEAQRCPLFKHFKFVRDAGHGVEKRVVFFTVRQLSDILLELDEQERKFTNQLLYETVYHETYDRNSSVEDRLEALYLSVPEPERIFNTLQRSNLDNKSLTDAEYREKRNARKLFGMPANVPAELRWGMSICKSDYLTDEEVKILKRRLPPKVVDGIHKQARQKKIDWRKQRSATNPTIVYNCKTKKLNFSFNWHSVRVDDNDTAPMP
jgi:hypothetical protein